jgi:hypothetical protein
LIYRKIKNPFLFAIAASRERGLGFTSISNQKIAENVNVVKTIRLFHDNRGAECTKNASLADEHTALNVRFGSDSVDPQHMRSRYQSGDLFERLEGLAPV